MPYRDDFYCASNLIGYTGQLNDFPTVYFHKPSTGEFGHITQRHDIKKNEGREAVRVANGGYRYVNEQVEDDNGVMTTALVEYSGTRVLHQSRNVFVAKDPSNEGTLLQAITNFPNEKALSVWFDLGDGHARPGIELMARGAPKDASGRRGAISSGSTIRVD